VHVPVITDYPNTGINGGGRPGSGEAPEGNGEAPEGFAGGTPNLGFKDFGRGKRVILHGLEAVVPIDRAEDFAARFLPPSLAPSMPIQTRLIPDRLSYRSDVTAMSQTFGSLIAQQNGAPDATGAAPVTYNVNIQATDAASFERLMRERGAPVVVEQIALGKGGLRETLKRGLNG
jgi:hypothetical protein